MSENFCKIRNSDKTKFSGKSAEALQHFVIWICNFFWPKWFQKLIENLLLQHVFYHIWPKLPLFDLVVLIDNEWALCDQFVVNSRKRSHKNSRKMNQHHVMDHFRRGCVAMFYNFRNEQVVKSCNDIPAVYEKVKVRNQQNLNCSHRPLTVYFLVFCAISVRLPHVCKLKHLTHMSAQYKFHHQIRRFFSGVQRSQLSKFAFF